MNGECIFMCCRVGITSISENNEQYEIIIRLSSGQKQKLILLFIRHEYENFVSIRKYELIVTASHL